MGLQLSGWSNSPAASVVSPWHLINSDSHNSFVIGKFIRFLRREQVESVLAKGSILSFLIQGMGALLFLLVEIAAARLLGLGQFGIYSMAAAWLYVLGLIGTLGFNHALLKFVPAYLAHREWASLRGIIRRSAAWVFAAALVMVAVGSVLLVILRNLGLEPAIASAFAVALAAIPFQVLSALRQAVLRGMNRIVHALAPEFILRPALFILLLAIAALTLQAPVTAATAFGLNLAAVLAAFLLGAYWQHKYLPAEVHAHAPAYHDREWLQTALPLLLIVGLNMVSSRIDIILLGMMSELEDVGKYSAASRVADVVVFGLVSANAVVAPMIARLHATRQHAELQSMVGLAARWIFFLTVPVALLIIIFGRDILGLFGQAFDDGYRVLVILVCGQLVNALSGPVGFLMTMTGHQAQAARIVTFSAVLNLALNLLLIPVWGMMGAALATAVSTATWNILMLHFVNSKLLIQASFVQFLWKRA